MTIRAARGLRSGGWVLAGVLISWAPLEGGRTGVRGADLEVSVDQERAEGEEIEFVFIADTDGITVLHRQAWFSCCFIFAPEVTLDGEKLVIREVDAGPPCLCPVVPWDIEVHVGPLAPGDYSVYLLEPMGEVFATARVTVSETQTALFIRGALNEDAAVDIADAISIVLFLFAGTKPPACLDAADANDSGGVDVSDAVYLLTYLFRGGPAPPQPFPEPGEDPTPDANICLVRNTVSAKNFLRNGDANGDGALDLSDCVHLLNYLRFGSSGLPCEDAVDFNDDGKIDMADALALCFPFGPLGPMAPADLGPIECGPDGTPDRLGCARSPCPR